MPTPEPVPESEPCCGYPFTEQPPPVPVCVLAPGHPGRHFPCLEGPDHDRLPHRYRRRRSAPVPPAIAQCS